MSTNYILVTVDAGAHISEIGTMTDLEMAKFFATTYKDTEDKEVAVLSCKNGVVEQVVFATNTKQKTKTGKKSSSKSSSSDDDYVLNTAPLY